jgi:gliding motility-associated-like protein
MKMNDFLSRLTAKSLLLLGVLFPVFGQAQWTFPTATPVNTASSLGNDCFQITTNQTSQRGVVWNNTSLNLNNPFDITLTVTMTGNQFGADGMAFVLQNTGLGAIGPGARSLGYLTDGALMGISPSIGVELDLRPNVGYGNDNLVAQDHTAIHENANPTSVTGPVQALVSGGDLSTGVCHEFRIVWVPPSTMTVFIDGSLRMTRNNNIVTGAFGGNPNVFWGITGSTGGSPTNLIVCAQMAVDVANAGPDSTICLGSTIQLQGSGGASYSWTDPANALSANNIAGPTFTPTVAGQYSFPLTTTINSCTDNDTVIITAAAPPVITINTNTGQNLLCAGGDLSITASGGGTYNWSNTATTANITVTQPGTYIVTVTDTSTSAMCTTVDSIIITQVNPPVAEAGPNETICLGDTIMIGGASSSGPGVTHSWTPVTTLNNATIAQPLAFPTATTQYFLTVDSASICSSIDSMTVTVNDTPSVTLVAQPDTICAGQSTDLTATPSGGSGAGYTFVWSSGGTAATETVTPTASNIFTVTVTDGNLCQTIGNVLVTVNTQDSIDIMQADTFTCNGGSVDITNTFGTPGIDIWQWSPTTGVSNPTDPNPTITPTVSTTYYLSGDNSSTGCGWMDSIRIEAYNLAVSHWTDTTVCLGDTISFDIQPTGGSGDYSYLWLSSTADTVGNDTAGNTGLRPTTAGTFTVMVNDNQTQCAVSFSINIQVSQLTVTATPSSEQINPGQRVQMLAFGAMFYTWSPDTTISCITCPDPVAMPGQSITYTVVGTDTNGCTGSATVQIIADSLLVPNVFTPNGDGINDVLLLNYYGDGDYEITVFDRWGRKIYASTDTNGTWDGRNSNGENLPDGVYYLVVRIVGDFAIPDADKQRVFNVTLMR